MHKGSYRVWNSRWTVELLGMLARVPDELRERVLEPWEGWELSEDGDVDGWLRRDGDGFGSFDVACFESCCTVL